MSVRNVFDVAVAALASMVRPLVDRKRNAHAMWLAVEGSEPERIGEMFHEGADEHWVLYPGYVQAAHRGVVTLEAAHKRYVDAGDFLARVPFEDGARYLKVDSVDGRERVARRPSAIWLEVSDGERQVAGEIYREGGQDENYPERWVRFVTPEDHVISMT